MSSIICFDRIENAKRILKEGVSANQQNANYYLKEAAWYLKYHTSYSPRQIHERMKKVAADYFLGMPQDYIDASISDIIEAANDVGRTGVIDELNYTIENPDGVDVPERKDNTPIPVYTEELKAISALGNEDTERLAFVFLIYSKYMKYPLLYQCNSALTKLAWRYCYDNKKKLVLGEHRGNRGRVNGSCTKDRLVALSAAGIVKFKACTTSGYRFNQNKPPASSMFMVPIQQMQGEISFEIQTLSEESLVLYYDRYKGYGGIVDCAGCGCPILKTNNKRKYCPKCAEKAKRSPKKQLLNGIA